MSIHERLWPRSWCVFFAHVQVEVLLHLPCISSIGWRGNLWVKITCSKGAVSGLLERMLITFRSGLYDGCNIRMGFWVGSLRKMVTLVLSVGGKGPGLESSHWSPCSFPLSASQCGLKGTWSLGGTSKGKQSLGAPVPAWSPGLLVITLNRVSR